MLKLFSRPEVDSEAESTTTLNTKVPSHIRIINGALDESSDSSSSLILNGRVDPATFHFLKVDNEYQRPLAERADIFNAMKEGRVVPNIEIGVRGQNFTTDGDDYIIHSPAYVIDGWQRVGNALRLLELVPHHQIRLFASIHFGTNHEWERHRFTELNKNVKRISPNLHMRNMRDQSAAILTLYGLCHTDPRFPLYKKVCWSQNMGRGQIMTALGMTKAVRRLHGHRVPNLGANAEQLARALSKIPATVTLPTFRRNISTFFSIVDQCWPLNNIQYRMSAPQIKTPFLTELARMFSDHPAFWEHNDNTLVVSADDCRKLSKFPINDPKVLMLAGSSGQSRQILYKLLVDHMNSNRRTNRLRSRFEGGE